MPYPTIAIPPVSLLTVHPTILAAFYIVTAWHFEIQIRHVHRVPYTTRVSGVCTGTNTGLARPTYVYKQAAALRLPRCRLARASSVLYWPKQNQ